MKKALHVKSYEVLLVVDGLHVKDVLAFEKHLKKEGLLKIENEAFAYLGKATLSLMHTRAFLFGTLKQAMNLSSTKNLSFTCLLGENPLEKYIFSQKDKTFKEILE